MVTKNGICLKLNESEYKLLKFGLIFYFSSKLYLDKFQNNVEKFVEEETIKLENKYKMKANYKLYLAISYYKKIEKRGFFIYDDISKSEINPDILFINVISK